MQRGQNSENLVMDTDSSAPVRCWHLWVKAFRAASKYLYAGIEETALCDTDFCTREALLNQGPLPLNTIAARVNRTTGPISVGVDRLCGYRRLTVMLRREGWRRFLLKANMPAPEVLVCVFKLWNYPCSCQ